MPRLKIELRRRIFTCGREFKNAASQKSTPQLRILRRKSKLYTASEKSVPQVGILHRNSVLFTATENSLPQV
jgi:hypothetical protein